MEYDYKKGKKTIYDFLTSKTDIDRSGNFPKNEKEFTYENGVVTNISAIFVDIIDSTNLFKSSNQEILARTMRAFVNQLVTILDNSQDVRDVGIRGDCVYAVYSTKTVHSVFDIFLKARIVNSFVEMFNKISADNGKIQISVGIGLGFGIDLVIKTGKVNTGINDFVYIGKAVVDASKLSSEANRNGKDKILMDNDFYYNLKKNYEFNNGNKEISFSTCKSQKISGDIYGCNYVENEFDDWINRGMNNE